MPASEAERALVARRRAELRRAPNAALAWEDVRAELWAEHEADERSTAATEGGSASKP